METTIWSAAAWAAAPRRRSQSSMHPRVSSPTGPPGLSSVMRPKDCKQRHARGKTRDASGYT
eukprot:11202184-Lingulodinium_polyedra.AAC.1